jgi:hypothetical protein
MKGAIALVLDLEVLEALKASSPTIMSGLRSFWWWRLPQPVVIWFSSISNLPLFWGRLGFPL